ncbi:tetratricopeptide repeat protein [Pedobacter frigoris]|uniref:Uncharacterized protein n=1 Tax=Pedobacter frigoris TaxID=2571272 RepID=A0A4U1CEN9_9SPHI|nr:hypothetical protein [Pedobacter frigoris]TKC04893.1 hypothetical protein FA047_14060 [Pedobacter frigoris]
MNSKQSSAASLSAYQVFDGIMDYIKKEAKEDFSLNYSIKSCDAVCNAVALTDRMNMKWIYFNPAFFNSMKGTAAQEKWFAYGVIAHEIGHQLLEHTTQSFDNPWRRKNELRADFFSGFVLSKLPGSTLEDALLFVKRLDDGKYKPANDTEAEYSIYPTLKKRLAAVEAGYNSADGDETKVQIFKDITNYAAKNGISIIFRKANLLLAQGKSVDAIKLLDEYLVKNATNPDVAVLFNERGLIKFANNDLSGAVSDLSKAISLSPDKAQFYTNRGLISEKGNALQKQQALKDLVKSEKLKVLVNQ